MVVRRERKKGVDCVVETYLSWAIGSTIPMMGGNLVEEEKVPY